MKRENDENQDNELHQDEDDNDDTNDKKPANKRSRKDEEEVRLLIPSKMAGAIIGKAGHNIQKLRTEYQAQVNVGDCTGPERVLTIGGDMETITKVVKDVMKHLDKPGENEYELRILVHQSLAGCVIGRGGTKIKELKDQIGCRLKIFSNIAPQSTDRIAQVIGTEEQCLTALNDIIGLIQGTPIKGPVHNYDPHNYDDMYAEEYGGYGIGGGGGGNFRNGRGSNAGGNSGGNAGGFDRRERFNERGGGGGGGGGRGYDRGNDRNRGGMSRDREFINPWAQNVNGNQMGGNAFGGGAGLGMGGMGAMNQGGLGGNMGSMPNMGNMGNMGNLGNMGNGNMGNFGAQNTSMDNKTSTQVTIPKDLAGAIIGKGGGRIRRIRNESNAFIQIDEALPGSTDRIITITGSQKEIQAAQYMLQQSVRENLAGGGGNGGGGFNRN